MRNWEHALAVALKGRWRRYRSALKKCQRTFSEPTIHASRIEARRLSANLELLRVFTSRRDLEEAARVLKRHLNSFDPLRDAHVQLLLIKKECRALAGAKRLRKLAVKRETRCRRKAARSIRRVKTRRLKKLIRLLIKRLEAGASDAERMRLDRKIILHGVERAFAKLVECRRHLDANDVATIHRMRIAFKHFRYMIESVQLLACGIRSQHLKTMRAFQKMLGELHDTDLFIGRVDKLIGEDKIDADDVAVFRRWLMRRRAGQIRLCMRRADVIQQFWPPPGS